MFLQARKRWNIKLANGMRSAFLAVYVKTRSEPNRTLHCFTTSTTAAAEFIILRMLYTFDFIFSIHTFIQIYKCYHISALYPRSRRSTVLDAMRRNMRPDASNVVRYVYCIHSHILPTLLHAHTIFYTVDTRQYCQRREEEKKQK